MSEEMNNAFEQGMDAYNAGDTDAARRHLTQAVRDDRLNAEAWFYLSKVQTDAEKARKCLERVLEIDPDHAEAQEAMAGLKVTNFQDLRRAVPTGGSGGGAKVPFDIPGAPERLNPQYVLDFVRDRVTDAVSLYSGKNAQADVSAASWWQVLFMGAIAGFITALASVIATAFIGLRFLNIVSVVGVPLLFVFYGALALGAGVFLSHWYLKSRGASAPLLPYAYVSALVWFPAALANAVVLLLSRSMGAPTLHIESLFRGSFSVNSAPAFIFTAISAAIAVAVIITLRKQLRPMFPGVEDNQLLIAPVILLVVTALVM